MSKAAQKAYTGATRLTLVNGITIPQIHIGVYETQGKECEKAVKWALEAGYRGIDSAEWYGNERDCGKAIASFLKENPSIQRSDIFFTTKLKTNTSYDATRLAIKKSLRQSGLEHIDLYLLHSPYGGKEARQKCYSAILDAIDEGEVKAAGVSNFGVKHIQELLQAFPNRPPSVNQIELHPFNTQAAIVKICRDNKIVLEAYAPLVRALRFKHPPITQLAKKYNVSPAAVLIKYGLQEDFVVLPKSVTKERIVDNLTSAEGWTLEEQEMETLRGLDEHLVTDWDPTNAP